MIEGMAETILIWIFAKQFCALFGITGGETLSPSISALRIVSLGFVFCSTVSLTTSYYMLFDRIGMATCIGCFQNGLLYIFKVVNGSWNDGKKDDVTVNLRSYEGDTLKLSANQIPAVGNKPDNNYKAGSWNVKPAAGTAITKDTTYTYTYVKKASAKTKPAPAAKKKKNGVQKSKQDLKP